jgi:hypothetical protein
MKINILLALIGFAFLSFIPSSFSQEYYKIDSGWGASVAASTSPAEVLVERNEGNDVAVNGTFADTTAWSTGTLWVINGGVATMTAPAATNAVLSETISSLTSGKTYRVQYTYTITGGLTNTVAIGGTTGTPRTATGTYVEDLTAVSGTTLAINTRANGISTNVIDNVSVRIAPQSAYITEARLSVGATDVPAYVVYNVDGNSFSNIYAVGHSMIVTSNSLTHPVVIKNSQGIRRIWYRSASGTPTLTINGY